MASVRFIITLVLISLPTLAVAETAVTDAHGDEIIVTDTSRVIALGGSLTEIIFALGVYGALVAVDSSSSYPPEGVAVLPEVGYVRNLAAEGVLSLEPSLIVTIPDAGPPEVLEQIVDAGVDVVVVPDNDSVSGATTKIATLADIFGVPQRAEQLILELELDLAEARLHTGSLTRDERLRVMFIYARGAGTVSVSGTGTSAHAMIELAGAKNAVTEYEGYRPLTAEAAINAEPDVLLFMSSGLQSVGGANGLAELPGLALTPAYQDNRIVAFDGLYLLGFGPRLGQAVLDLARALYTDRQVATP